MSIEYYKMKFNVENPTDEWLWHHIRLERNKLLAECDWTMLPDANVNIEIWKKYRQELRDLPSMNKDPNKITFPKKP